MIIIRQIPSLPLSRKLIGVKDLVTLRKSKVISTMRLIHLIWIKIVR